MISNLKLPLECDEQFAERFAAALATYHSKVAAQKTPILSQFDAARAYHAAAKKSLTPQHVPIDPRGLIGTWTPEPINPQELSPTPPKGADEKADRKRSDIEENLSNSAAQLIFSARYSAPTDKPPSSYYVAGVHTYVPPTEPEDSDDWVGDFFGNSYWDRKPCDFHVTYPDYFPNMKDKYSVLNPDSTSPTCPMDILSPEAFVDDQEVLLHAKRSDTIWCSKYPATLPISNYY